jgi:hypothetical protein
MRYLPRAPYPPPPSDLDTSLTSRPRHISGLALLRGVFLSTGSARSASDFSLITAGAGFILLFGVSTVLAYGVVYVLGRALPQVPLVAIYTYTLPVTYPDPYVAWRIGVHAIRFAAFLALLRLSPIAGYHGAEHKVVNAIEQTGSLDEDVVRKMPRQHMRCGTNLLAGLAPLLLELTPDVNMSPATLVILLIVGLLLRREIGYVVQTVFTTKEPSTRQLRAGIESGRQLWKRWINTPPHPTAPVERLWGRGLPQLGLGLCLGILGLHYASMLAFRLLVQGL